MVTTRPADPNPRTTGEVPRYDPSTRDAMYRDLVHLAGSTRWPDGRRMLAAERRRLVRFLVETFG